MNQLPLILEYFIPGFIFIRIFQLLTSRKDSSYQLIISVAISYILKAICSICHEYVLVDVTFSWSRRVIILSLFASFLSVIMVLFTEIKYINNILLHINNKSIHDDIWQDVIDYRNGTTLRFVCGDTIYTGVLVGHEEKGNDSWFILEDFIIDNPQNYYQAEDMTCYARIAVNLKNVDRVELYYGEPKKFLENTIKTFFKTVKIKKETKKEHEKN